jgi:hypothetical protein
VAGTLPVDFFLCDVGGLAPRFQREVVVDGGGHPLADVGRLWLRQRNFFVQRGELGDGLAGEFPQRLPLVVEVVLRRDLVRLLERVARFGVVQVGFGGEPALALLPRKVKLALDGIFFRLGENQGVLRRECLKVGCGGAQHEVLFGRAEGGRRLLDRGLGLGVAAPGRELEDGLRNGERAVVGGVVGAATGVYGVFAVENVLFGFGVGHLEGDVGQQGGARLGLRELDRFEFVARRPVFGVARFREGVNVREVLGVYGCRAHAAQQ